jgi:hypothetical protein
VGDVRFRVQTCVVVVGVVDVIVVGDGDVFEKT